MVRGVCQRESTFDTDPRPVPAVLPLIRGRAEPSVTAPFLDIYKPITDTSLSGRHPRPHPFSHPLLSLNSSSNLQSFASAATTATHSSRCRSLGAPSRCSPSLPSQRLHPRQPSRLPLATSPASGHPMVRYLSSASMPRAGSNDHHSSTPQLLSRPVHAARRATATATASEKRSTAPSPTRYAQATTRGVPSPDCPTIC